MSHPQSESTKAVSALALRIHGWSWQAFPIGMGTGAVYVVLSSLEYRASWLTVVENIFLFLNISIFLLNCSTLFLQLILFPSQSKRLLLDPVKSIYVPLAVLSFSTIIIGAINYAEPTGFIYAELIYKIFWLYITFSLLISFPMLMIWFNQKHEVNSFTPSYAFLVFPMMLVGLVASNVLRVLSPNDERALGVLIMGYFFQGIGFFMSFFYLAIYLLRLITTGFMAGQQANGAFVACGPPGFTALALIHLGAHARSILPQFDLVSPLAGEVWYASSVMTAILLYGLAVFLFVFGVLPYWFKVDRNLGEILGCWVYFRACSNICIISILLSIQALTFPNVGWINTTKALGDIFHVEGLLIVHACMTTLLVLTWIVLTILTVVAFWKGKIFMSQPAAVLQDSFHRIDDEALSSPEE